MFKYFLSKLLSTACAAPLDWRVAFGEPRVNWAGLFSFVPDGPTITIRGEAGRPGSISSAIAPPQRGALPCSGGTLQLWEMGRALFFPGVLNLHRFRFAAAAI